MNGLISGWMCLNHPEVVKSKKRDVVTGRIRSFHPVFGILPCPVPSCILPLLFFPFYFYFFCHEEIPLPGVSTFDHHLYRSSELWTELLKAISWNKDPVFKFFFQAFWLLNHNSHWYTCSEHYFLHIASIYISLQDWIYGTRGSYKLDSHLSFCVRSPVFRLSFLLHSELSTWIWVSSLGSIER